MKHLLSCCLAVLILACGMAQGTPSPIFIPERVPVLGDSWQEPGESFSFAILGDKTSGGEGKWPIFDRAVADINGLKPFFVITTGDHIPGHMEERAPWDAEWAEYLEHAGKLNCPLVMIPGNHDIANTQCYQFWQEDRGATYFSFVYGNCLFLVLNTEEERFDGRGPVWQTMMTFVERALNTNTGVNHTFLFFHKPMWADPRFQGDWQRLLTALGERRFTAVAGHEHYLSTSSYQGNTLVIMNATGGGLQESKVHEFGCFHAFAQVNVTPDDIEMTIIEPGGPRWPVTVAPASFRAAVNRQVVRLDAQTPEGLGSPTVRVHAFAQLENPFDKAITVRLSVAPLVADGWIPAPETDLSTSPDRSACSLELALEPGQQQRVAMPFDVPDTALALPPAVAWDIRYDGQWLTREAMPMEEVNAVPLYPSAAWRDISHWQVAGPFPLGAIDVSRLPEDPKAACPGLFAWFGPEDGHRENARFAGDVSWRPAVSSAQGLLNLNAILGTVDLAAAFNAFAVYSPGEQRTHALVYADNFAQVYVNGVLQERAQEFGAGSGWVYAPLSLHAGWNDVVVKVINNRGDWFLRCLVADPRGDLRFSDGAGPR